VKRKSVGGSEDVVDRNRRSSLRSSRPLTPPDSRSANKKADVRKMNSTSTGHSASSSSSSEDDSDDGSASSDTEVSQPAKQCKLGIRLSVVISYLCKKMLFNLCALTQPRAWTCPWVIRWKLFRTSGADMAVDAVGDARLTLSVSIELTNCPYVRLSASALSRVHSSV